MMPRTLPLIAFVAMFMAACVSAPGAIGRSTFATGDAPSKEAREMADYLVARYAAMTNDPDEAARRYGAAIDTAPRATGIGERAVFSALLANDYYEATRLAERAAARGGNTTLVRLTLGIDAMVKGRSGTAAAHLDNEAFGPFNKMVVRGVSAWRVRQDQGTDAAVRFLDGSLTGDDRLDSVTLYMKGLILMSEGNYPAALATFEALWESGARLAVGVDAHARLLAEKGDAARALEILTIFRDEIGYNAGLEETRGHIAAGKRVRPPRYSTRQGAALAVFVPASALMAQTSDDLSAVYFVLALALDPKLDVARTLLGQSLDQGGRHSQAVDVLSEIKKSSVFYATARGQMAWSLLRQGREAEALKVAGEALDYAPDRGLKIQLADLYRSLLQYDKAEPILTDVIDEDASMGREDWRVLFARGAAREQLGKWPEAEADLKHALKLQPDNPVVLNYLGYSYVDRGENLTEAFDMIQRAVNLDPQSGMIVDSLGWAHYRMGRYDLATTYLERAVELEPGDVTLNDHLGDAYWRVGRKKEARFQWQRALSLEPLPKERALIEPKLTSGPPDIAPEPDRASTSAPLHP